MKSLCLRLAACVLSIFALAAYAGAQSATDALAGELQRLQQLAKSQPNNADWADVEPSISQHLLRAQEALATGRKYFALQNIGEARVLLQSYLTVQQKTSELQNGLPAFESHWNKAKLQLSSLDTEARKRDWSRRLAAARALSEAAQGQSMTVLDASKAYAGVTEPKAGYYYLGEAQGDADFAAFAHSLNLPSQTAPLALRSVLPDIQALQKRTDELFQPPLSIEKHSQFIRLNSTIKLAGELDANHLRYGALYEYLFAVQQLALLQTEKVPLDSELRQAVEAARIRVSKSKKDNSIAELFLQKAETALDPKTGGLGTVDQNRHTAAAVLLSVLPAYYAYLSGPSTAIPKSQSAVTVTLVRWPYT